MSKKEEKELTNEEIAQVVAFKLGKEFVKGQAVSLIADCLGGGGLFLLIEEVREVCVATRALKKVLQYIQDKNLNSKHLTKTKVIEICDAVNIFSVL